MDIQKLTYFVEGNTFTGGATKDGEKGLLLRYRVEPDNGNGQLLAWAWTRDVCFERAGDTEEKTFLMTEEGLAELDAWLQGLFDAL